jgi:DNA ligase-associated metallophosphoesterase
MQNPVPHIIHQNTFWVSPERTLFWEEENTLIVADVHIGKTGHFRREGIPIPQNIFKADLQRLMAQIYLYKTDRLLIVGDFSHSIANKEMELFLKWRKDFSLLRIDLVKGNHDILDDDWYSRAAITMHEWELVINNFCFRHEDKRRKPLEKQGAVNYTFTGHVHPGIKLKGQARQSFMFPCFYFGREGCILPAFSKFTGTHKIVPAEGDTVYAVAGNELIKMV